MRAKIIHGLAATAMLAVPLTAGTASAGAPAASRTIAAPQGCTHWYLYNKEGTTEGYICGYYATGWVRDDRADGRCPFTRFYTWDDEVVDGPLVGPKGTVKNFTVYAPNGGQFLGYASIKWASC